VTAVIVSLALGLDGSVRGEATIGGHPRPLIVRADGSTETIEPAGTAPGLPMHRAAPVVAFELDAGDALILYTDGVTDVPGAGALTPEQFAELVAGVSAGSADDVATAVGKHLEEIRPFELRSDDIAVVVAKVPS
jgi:serine phosphatase RsbU (regulator of sigma subunit)